MEEKEERDKKVGRVEMDSNVEIQTVSLALRLLPFLPFKKMIKKKKKTDTKPVPDPILDEYTTYIFPPGRRTYLSHCSLSLS